MSRDPHHDTPPPTQTPLLHTILCNVLVEALHSGVVTEEIQALPVRLPQELHPRSKNRTIVTILVVLVTDGAHQ